MGGCKQVNRKCFIDYKKLYGDLLILEKTNILMTKCYRWENTKYSLPRS